MDVRRARAVMRKELRELRHNGNIVYAMIILPLVFLIQPTVQVFTLSSGASSTLNHEHTLLYLLAIPALVPSALAAYSIVGERIQSTLEPVLTSPVSQGELLLGKCVAALLPSAAIAYLAYGLFVVAVELFAPPAIAHALIRGPEVAAQIVFTPLLATWSIWIAIGISSRASDPRTAAQLSILASLPSVAVTTLITFNVIPATLATAVVCAALLLALSGLGWRAASAIFDRERLITNTR